MNLAFRILLGVEELPESSRSGQQKETYDDQEDKHGRKAGHVDGFPPCEREQQVADEDADHEACRYGDVDVESLDLVEPCCLEEDHRIAGQGVSVEDL